MKRKISEILEGETIAQAASKGKFPTAVRN
jgi:hypothetical protein